jgi:hypothetical protein
LPRTLACGLRPRTRESAPPPKTQRRSVACARRIGHPPASWLGKEAGYFKGDVRHSPDEIGNRRIGFEAHPFHTEFAFPVTDDKSFQVFKWVSPGFDSLVGIPMW